MTTLIRRTQARRPIAKSDRVRRASRAEAQSITKAAAPVTAEPTKATPDVETLRLSAQDSRVAAGAVVVEARNVSASGLSLLLSEKSAASSAAASAPSKSDDASAEQIAQAALTALRAAELPIVDEAKVIATLTRIERSMDLTGLDADQQRTVKRMMTAAIVEQTLLNDGYKPRGLSDDIVDALELNKTERWGYSRITSFGVFEQLAVGARHGTADISGAVRRFERSAKRCGIPASTLFECSLTLCRRDMLGDLAEDVVGQPIGAYPPVRNTFVALLRREGTWRSGTHARSALNRFALAGTDDVESFAREFYRTPTSVIGPLKALGNQFLELAADTGVAHRIDDFVDFVRQNGLTEANVWEARQAYSNSLGTCELFRGMTLEQADLDAIDALGVQSHVIRGSWSDNGDPLFEQLRGHILGQHISRSNLISTTSVRQIAEAMSRQKRERRADARQYLFRILMPVLDTIAACGTSPATDGIESVVGLMRRSQLEIELADKSTQRFSFDDDTETLIAGLVGSDELVEVTKLDRDNLPKWRQVPVDDDSADK